jgi:hypothetical protein
VCNFNPISKDDTPYISGLIGVKFSHLRMNIKRMQNMRVSTVLEHRVHNVLFTMPGSQCQRNQFATLGEIQWDR